MFPDESDQIEWYIGGLPDMIYESVVASKPKIAYTAGSGESKEYTGTLPLCNKCKFHHNGQCTVNCVNCKRVGHLTRDYRSPAATNNHRNPTCYECRNQGHYKSDSSELKNQDQGNQARGTRAHGMVQALEGGETNQDRNDVEDDPLPSAKIAQAKEIVDLMKRVKKLKRKKKSRNSGLKRLWKVGSTTRVESSEDKETLGDQEDASK
nr:hypothetical protein [Tanacetum cinerariifolium]